MFSFNLEVNIYETMNTPFHYHLALLHFQLERIGPSGRCLQQPSMQIASHCRLSVACNRAVIVRVQIVYLLMFTNWPLRDRKAVLIAQPSENVPSHHFRTVIILVVEIVVSDGDIAVC